MFATRLALLFTLLIATTGGAPRESLPHLLDRMRESGGPAWSAHLASTSLLTMDGASTRVTSDSQGVRFATYECAKSLCDGEYFDGERLYSININRTTLPQSDLGDAFLRAERTIASHAFLSPEFADDGGAIADDGFTTIEGTSYRTILVSNSGSVPMQVFIDPSTARIRYLRDITGESTIEYRDYRHVGSSLVLPFLVMRNGSVLERYEDRSVRPDPFTQPRGFAPAFAGPPTPVATDPNRTIPVFSCTIDGIATTCLLDTGNSGLAISEELVARLHPPVVGQIQISGLGKYVAQIVRTGPLSAGNATFPEANYVVLRDIHRFGYDVVLGADVLASTRIELDPSAHRIMFDVTAAPPGETVSLHFLNFVPIISVQLGSVGAQLALDTGDESNINLSYDFYNEHRDLFAATEQRIVSGVGGSSIEFIGNIPEVKIGSISVRDQRIGTTTTLRSTAYGHLGAGFLGQFTVLLDYARSRVEFIHTSAGGPGPSRK
ncbi:MAG: aspartyl protease family protein [Candidatus Baltobacteraceae bacterium]